MTRTPRQLHRWRRGLGPTVRVGPLHPTEGDTVRKLRRGDRVASDVTGRTGTVTCNAGPTEGREYVAVQWDRPQWNGRRAPLRSVVPVDALHRVPERATA